MDWQCAKCGSIEYNMRTKNDLKINYIRGECTEQPLCSGVSLPWTSRKYDGT